MKKWKKLIRNQSNTITNMKLTYQILFHNVIRIVFKLFFLFPIGTSPVNRFHFIFLASYWNYTCYKDRFQIIFLFPIGTTPFNHSHFIFFASYWNYTCYKDRFQIIIFCFLLELHNMFSVFSCPKLTLLVGWVASFSLLLLFPDKVCDISKLYDFLTMHVVYLSIQFCENSCDILSVYNWAILYQSLVVSIETKKK